MKKLNEDEIVDILRITQPDDFENGPDGYEWELIVGQFAKELGINFEKFLTKCQR